MKNEVFKLDYKLNNNFKNQLLYLKRFVTDEQWLKIVSFDFALNPKLASDIVKLIKKINSNVFCAEKLEPIIVDIKAKMEKLIILANLEKDIVLKWLKYREIYAYYGFLETIIEGSIITKYIFSQFKKLYGKNYLQKIKEIDTNKHLIYNSKKEKDITDLYLLMKKWQDIEHEFSDQILLPKYLKAKNNFNKKVYDEKKHLKNIKDISLVYLYFVDDMPIVNIQIIARLIESNNAEYLNTVIGGKMYGLAVLWLNKFKIPETYVIPVSSVLNKNYQKDLEKIKFNKYAIRSSATAEDGTKHSYAGMFLTNLEANQKDVPISIENVARSINYKRVINYIDHFNLEKPYMAVILQDFKKSFISGVWLGEKLTSGNLEWIYGTGELLVSGHSNPNHEYWNRDDINNSKGINYQLGYVGQKCLEIQEKLETICDLEWCIVDNDLIILQFRPVTSKLFLNKVKNSSSKIVGIPSSSGIVSGEPVFLKDYKTTKRLDGKILMADYTDPEWIPLIIKAKAVVTAEGGALSHTAIITRELGIPSIVGIGYKNIDYLKKEKRIKINGNTGEICIENSPYDKLKNIKNPEELIKFMEENITYGFVDKNGKKYLDMFSKEWQDNWFNKCIVQTGKEILKTKIGTCWDQVELERLWFREYNYQFKTIFIEFQNNKKSNLPTHTFLVYKDKGEYYWFEHSFYDNRGIHKFKNYEDAIEFVKRKHLEYAINNYNIDESYYKHIKAYEYEEIPKGLGVSKYLNWIIKK